MDNRIIKKSMAVMISLLMMSGNAYAAPVIKSISAFDGINEIKTETSAGEITDNIENKTDIKEKNERPEKLYYNKAADGRGTAVALIDFGFSADNDLFTLSEEYDLKLTRTGLSEKMTDTYAYKTAPVMESGTHFYINNKIPFAFNYGDCDYEMAGQNIYGTFAMGIIGANNKSGDKNGFFGAAPETQLMLMKVVSADGLINEKNIAAAVNDAVVLGADVIYINPELLYKIGSDGEFAEAVNNAYAKGVLAVTGAGEFGTVGTGSIYDAAYGIKNPVSVNPDYGTLPDYAEIEGLIVAGKAEFPLVNGFVFSIEGIKDPETGEAAEIEYTDTNINYDISGGRYFADIFGGKTVDYEIIGGNGEESAYNIKSDLGGKTAVVKRGGITFTEKVNIAASHGAGAVIIYDNEETGDYVNMNLEGAKIPAVFVSNKSGLMLINSPVKKIVFPEYKELSPVISPDSSRGGLSDLSAGIDISAPGMNLPATVEKNGVIGGAAGSPVAAALAAGTAAAVRSYINGAGIEYENAAEMTAAIMASSAELSYTESDEESGMLIYSPRSQGAGIINIDRAVTCPIIFGNVKNGETVNSIGEISGNSIELKLKASNISGKDQIFKVKADILSDSLTQYDRSELNNEESDIYKTLGIHYDEIFGIDISKPLPFFIGEASRSVDDALVSVNNSAVNINGEAGSSITVKAGETVELNLKISLTDSFVKRMNEICPNGFFIDGYITLIPEDKSFSDSKCPFTSFAGGWDKAPAVGNFILEGSEYYISDYFYTSSKCPYYEGDTALGQNYLVLEDGQPIIYDKSLAAVSTEFDGNGELWMSVNPLRNIKSHTVRIKSADGTIIFEENRGPIEKAHQNQYGNLISYTEMICTMRAYDNYDFHYPDGTYTCEIVFESEYGSVQHESFDFLIDTAAPEIGDYRVYEENGRKFIEIQASDNHRIQAVYVYDSVNSFKPADDTPVRAKSAVSAADGKIRITFDITESEKNTLYVDIIDYAFNTSVIRIKLG